MSNAAKRNETAVAPAEHGLRTELLAATDAQIDEAVKFTDPMALRGVLYQLTGDESIAATATEKTRVFFAQTYFMNEHARSSIISPFAPSEQWNRLRPVRFEDFIIE